MGWNGKYDSGNDSANTGLRILGKGSLDSYIMAHIFSRNIFFIHHMGLKALLKIKKLHIWVNISLRLMGKELLFPYWIGVHVGQNVIVSSLGRTLGIKHTQIFAGFFIYR